MPPSQCTVNIGKDHSLLFCMIDPEFEEQHPIPQQISSYHFRLVGDMTLKQFFMVAGGSIIALIIYSTGLSPIIKIPLIIISFASGVALAFLPLQDRPLEKWIYLFFKSIYSPTLFVWKQSDTPPTYFRPEGEETITPIQPQTPKNDEVLSSQQPAATPAEEEAQSAQSELEQKEQQFLSKVSGEASKDPSDKPTGVVTIPKQEMPAVEKGEGASISDQPTTDISENVSDITRTVSPFANEEPTGSGVSPTFIPEASPPSPPTQPNILVGQITDAQGKIIDSAIMDIRDENGRPARAFKSNKLGHFMIATPLVNGKYNITIEKEGYDFDAISIDAKGEMFPPMSIVGKKIPVSQEGQIPAEQNKN